MATAVALLVKLPAFRTDGSFNYVFDRAWFGPGMHFTTGIDGISMLMLLLTNILTPVILLSLLNRKEAHMPWLAALALGMQGALNGVFLSLDGLMFYIFWELALIPIYFICAFWSEGEHRFRISLKFFLYTFLGSLGMLASLIYLYLKTPGEHSFAYAALLEVTLTHTEAIWVGLGILLAFAVKIPLLPLHSWQPDTYTAAPAQGSMLLSGIMLKMGLYGLMRWFLPIVPEAIYDFMPWIIGAAVVGVLYGALIAIRLDDMKRITAFASLSHVGLIAAGIATMSLQGWQGGLLQSMAHGVNVVGVFIAIDIIQQRSGTRLLSQLGGIARQAPLLATAFLILVLGTVAVPFSNGFPGELLLIKSIFDYQHIWGLLAGLTIILCAVYMLRMYQFSMLGKETGGIYMFPDLRWNEMLALGILVVLVLVNGLFPQMLLDISENSVKKTFEIIMKSIGGVG